MDDINNYVFSKDNYLGKGSFSRVYLGKNIINNEEVAVKIINISKCNQYIDINKEIEILRELHHENIVKLEDSILKDEQLYIILEYCSLGDLNKFFNKVAIKEIYVKHYAKQIIDGLMYLSSKNIMHRDIKPHNILLKNIYTIKLTDFGFAKHYNNTDMTSTLCGSPIYMAPEIMKLKNYNYKADIWSLGVVLYELLFAEHPFTARNHFELVKVIENNEVKFLDYPAISNECKQFITILLNKNPLKRASFNDIVNHQWLKNNTIIILSSSSTYQLYNEFIVNKNQNLNISDSNNCISLDSDENIFNFDNDDMDINSLTSINLSDTDSNTDSNIISNDYVMIDENVKTIALTYSLHDIYNKFIDDYFT
jgi:serine/threonine-protein kinase ULK/ATG1